MIFTIGDGPHGESMRRPNVCGGPICFTVKGTRYRPECANDAMNGEALCSSCKARERDELCKESDRVQAANPKSPKTTTRRGGY